MIMGKNEKKLACFLWGGFAILFLLIDLSLVYGFILGSLVSVVLYKRTERFCTAVLSSKSSNKGFMYLNFMINFGLMALTLLICAIKPEILNIFGAALGLMLIKATIVFNAVFLERRKDHAS